MAEQDAVASAMRMRKLVNLAAHAPLVAEESAQRLGDVQRLLEGARSEEEFAQAADMLARVEADVASVRARIREARS